MKSINLKNVQAVRERLLEQIFILQTLKEEIQEVKKRIEFLSGMEAALHLLEKSKGELEQEIRIYKELAECLRQVFELYQKTEQRIVEVYELEQIIYPETSFGVSRLTDLESVSRYIGLIGSGEA